MNFLDKLYESNYFGIGLFAVISFLVVTFLIVLFFGKRDEKRRLESTKNLNKVETDNTFKETSAEVPVEVPVVDTPVVTENVMPVMPTIEEPVLEPVTPSTVLEPASQPVVTPVINEPIAPINFKDEPLTPVAPINYDQNEFVEMPKEEVTPISVPVAPIINEEPAPIKLDTVQNVEPIRLEPTTYDIPAEPKVIEPIRITIPEEPVKPVVEEVKPVIMPTSEVTPTIVEPTINDTYYKPIEKVETEEIEVPGIDFDALAKSISDELDELENSSNTYHDEVKVTPINEVVSKPTTQFSSVYVNEPVKPVVSESMDLPKKIDLPTMKSSEIEPENYDI